MTTTITEHDRMNPEIKKRWVEALRSGEYEQGRGFLRWEDKFCCWGVLCELAATDAVIPPGKRDEFGEYTYGEDLIYQVMPPHEVLAWADASDELTVPVVDQDGDEHLSLAIANDAGVPFSFIADYIEENL